jgi:hypothetical protein
VQLAGRSRHRVEPLSHLGIRLKERFRRNPQHQLADPLLDRLDTRDQLRLAAAARLCEGVGARPQHAVGADRLRQRVAIECAGAGDQPHLELAGPPPLAHHEVAQKARVLAAIERGEPLFATPREDLPADLVAALGGEQAVLDALDLLPRPGGVEAADQVPSAPRPNEYSSLLR